MRPKLFLLFVLCLVCLFSAEAQTVNEAESSIILNEKTADLSIVIENSANSFDGKIELEILDAENKIRANIAQNVQIKKGKEIYWLALPLGDLMQKAGDEISWYRLHYRVGQAEGFVSLSELAKDVFELRVAASENVLPGTDYRVRVRALHPFTKLPVGNVKVQAELKLEIDTDEDEDELKLTDKSETDDEGFATLHFKIPENLKLDEDGDLNVTGRKNGVVREIDEDLDFEQFNGSVFLTADKPIYQPGQSFNARALYFDKNQTVVAGEELEFTVKDEDDTTLYRETVKTSDFGIASISWKIPDGAKLGSYRVEVEASDELQQNRLYFKVSRYDLPNFTVAAAPDKTFYLPEDRQAEITVAAMYLFGKPVSKGKIRVVQESERRWNYKTQNYDTEEKQSIEGEADAEGKYVAKVDLSEAMSDLKNSSWQRFEDLHFAAYFTDSTTNRTEQKRFDLRLTKEAIHVYIVGRRYELSQKLPISAYVSTFYADGKPAVCDVQVQGKNDAESRDTFKTLQRLKTNSFGAGKLYFSRPDGMATNDDLALKVTARDQNGQTGTFEDEISYYNETDGISLEVEKTIYKPGESVKINLLSSKKDAFVYVDIVLPNRSVLESRVVKFEDGKANVKIPYNPNFKGDLIVAAYGDDDESRYDAKMHDSQGIIYPTQQNLKLSAEFSAETYKPNEEAKVKFSVTDGVGKTIESALGVVVFDKAIEERAKTDAEFGSYFSRFYGLLGYSKSFGGITLKDLNELDLSKPVSGEMQLAAEVMLSDSVYFPQIYHSTYNEAEAKSVYAEFFKKQLAPLENALKTQFEKNYAHPTDDASLRKILSENGVNFDNLRDPWGQNYSAIFTTEKMQNIITLRTVGADKKLGTKDDFDVSSASFAYFTPTGKAIDKAVENYHKRTGGYIRDLPTLSAELAKQDVDLSKIKDRWSRDYRIDFKVSGRKYAIVFRSYGANGYYQPYEWSTDDFDVWKSEIDYFAETESRIDKIFSETVNAGKKIFPASENEFKQILKEKGLDFNEIRDGFGEPVYIMFSKYSRYDDKVKVENGKQNIIPVTEEVGTFTIRSKGADRIFSADDFDLATLSGVLAEQSKDTNYSKSTVKTVTFSGAMGAIRGTVFDQNGAVVPGATVMATNQEDETKTYNTATDENGFFLLGNLPSAKYKVVANATNFNAAVYSNIQVRSQNLIEMNITLQIGATAMTDNVTADAEATIDQSSTKLNTNITMQQTESLPVNGRKLSNFAVMNPKQKSVTQTEENSTPRLREYFPETLLWQPEVITDKNGKAELKFKLADNITTWKLYTIASTKNGKIGVTEKEITAFQPFFVDLEPPKFLTNGDEISLPVQIRNYTESKQKVNVSMASGSWFAFLNEANQQIEVAPDTSENAIFGFKAISAIKDGKQKVTATAPKDSDAIEKSVTVRPNGQEIVKTESQLFRESAAFDINFPANALPKTQKAEMKIYPNLLSHVAESVEGLLQRPYGCGEQTTSSTYPNLMILKFTKGDSKLRQTAQKYLQKGYERLLGYQVADGGFSYWGGKDESNIALTAYVLRFLSDAKDFINVDEEVVKRAQNWLTGQQKPDGSWTKKYYWETSEDASRTKLFTSYVARTLAMSKQKDETVLQKALAYLKTRNAEIDEPYALALFGLASLDAGNVETAREVAQRLEKMAIAEGGSVYWKLETNTPFYGWGTAGRVETTALVLQLLIREAQTRQVENAERNSLISKATLFLLKNKDRYGVWYSTQTTINVLDAFLATLTENPKSEIQTLQIFLNGANLQNVSISPDKIEPVVLDLTGKLTATINRLEIKNSANSAVMSQVVSTHYIDWRDSDVSNQNENASRLLRLDYKCDKPDAKIMEEINCAVEAERVGFRGYGMLLAEIGLPPGADVSRESLEKAMEADWSLSRYDILPDRIILYMWSKAGGTKFNFKFRPRYGINAQTPASVVYDYYNEEAKATVAPMKFSVK